MQPSEQINIQDAARVSSALDGNMMSAARMLRAVRDQRPNDLKDVAKKAGMSLRNAYILARVATVFDGRRVPDQRLQEIGSTKLDLLAGYVDEDASNLEELLTLAERCSPQQLKTTLQGKSLGIKQSSMMLHLPEEEDQRFRSLLARFGATVKGKGLANKEGALIALMDALDALPSPLEPVHSKQKRSPHVR